MKDRNGKTYGMVQTKWNVWIDPPFTTWESECMAAVHSPTVITKNSCSVTKIFGSKTFLN